MKLCILCIQSKPCKHSIQSIHNKVSNKYIDNLSPLVVFRGIVLKEWEV